MSRWFRPLFFAVTVVAALHQGLASAADTGTAAPPPPTQRIDPLPRVTLDLSDVNILEAAERISAATDLRLHVPTDHDSPYLLQLDVIARNMRPAVDYTHKARFSWKDASLGQVYREFARAYNCRLIPGLMIGGLADLAVLGGAAPNSPTAPAEGFQVGVNMISLEAHGRRWANSPRPSERHLHVEFSIRAVKGDPCSVLGVSNVRATDTSGRTYREPEDDDLSPQAPPSEWHNAISSAFPDELVCSTALDWPYPAPRAFRALEGDLILSKTGRRLHHEFPMPEGRGRPVIDREGDVTWEFDWLSPTPAGFERNLKITVPRVTANLMYHDAPTRLAVVLQDGRKVLPQMDGWNYWDEASTRMFWTTIRVHHLPSPPVRLVWEPGLRANYANDVRRVHFRLENLPVHLDGGNVPTPPAPQSKPQPKPAPRPVAPKGRKQR